MNRYQRKIADLVLSGKKIIVRKNRLRPSAGRTRAQAEQEYQAAKDRLADKDKGAS